MRTTKTFIVNVVCFAILWTSAIATSTGASAQQRRGNAEYGAQFDRGPGPRVFRRRDRGGDRWRGRDVRRFERDRPRASRRYAPAPYYAHVRKKRRKKKRIGKIIAIGAGLLALGIIASHANKRR